MVNYQPRPCGESGDRMTSSTDELVVQLRPLDVCAVADACETIRLEGVVAGGLAPLWEGARLAGRARTVLLVPSTGNVQSGIHLGARLLDTATEGDVIVIDNAGRTGMGAWGGILTHAAALRGVAGVVIDGACRDLDEARDAAFPVFARATAARTARGRVEERAFDIPVHIDGVTVVPGDLILADASGVAVIPAARGDEVLACASRISEREAEIRRALSAGSSVSTAMGESYERMLSPERRRC